MPYHPIVDSKELPLVMHSQNTWDHFLKKAWAHVQIQKLFSIELAKFLLKLLYKLNFSYIFRFVINISVSHMNVIYLVQFVSLL